MSRPAEQAHARRSARRRMEAQERRNTYLSEEDAPTAHRRRHPGNSLRALKPPSLRQLVPGTVALSRITFTDGTGYKARPCVVLHADHRHVWVLPLTSSPRRATSGTHELWDWKAAGLSRPSATKSDVEVVDRHTEVFDVWGTLSALDWLAVEAISAPLLAARTTTSVFANAA